MIFHGPLLPGAAQLQSSQVIDVAAQSTGSGVSDGSSQFTLVMPSGNGSGDILIAYVVCDGTASAPTGWPSGWASLASSGEGTISLHAYWKRLTAAESDFALTHSGGVGAGYQYDVHRVENAHASSAPEAATANGNDAAPNPPSLTPSWGSEGNLWAVAIAVNGVTDTVTGYPSGYSDDQYTNSSDGCGIGVATKIATAASDDPGTFTLSGSDRWLAFTIAVRPAGGLNYYSLTCDAGSFTLTGQAATLLKTSILSADAGAFTLTGQDATLSYGRSLVCEAGAFTLTGQDADLTLTPASATAPKGRKKRLRWRPWNPWQTDEKPYVIEDGAIKPVPAPPFTPKPIEVDLAPIYAKHDAITSRMLRRLREEEDLMAALLAADDDY